MQTQTCLAGTLQHSAAGRRRNTWLYTLRVEGRQSPCISVSCTSNPKTVIMSREDEDEKTRFQGNAQHQESKTFKGTLKKGRRRLKTLRQENGAGISRGSLPVIVSTVRLRRLVTADISGGNAEISSSSRTTSSSLSSFEMLAGRWVMPSCSNHPDKHRHVFGGLVNTRRRCNTQHEHHKCQLLRADMSTTTLSVNAEQSNRMMTNW